MNGFTVLNYNFKGGVGKTTSTAMETYVLQKEKKKVLLIDFDPQQNLTEVSEKTYNYGEKFSPKNSLNNCLNNHSLDGGIVHASDYLDIVPNDSKTDIWFRRSRLRDEDRFNVLNNLLRPVKADYDYIFVDVPPSMNDLAVNAIMAADGVSIVLQTQQMAFTSALKTMQYLSEFRKEQGAHFAMLGIMIYLFRQTAVNRKIADKAKKMFGDGVFNSEIKNQERVNGFMYYGIKDNDYWDHRSVGMYWKLTDELRKRIEKVEQ